MTRCFVTSMAMVAGVGLLSGAGCSKKEEPKAQVISLKKAFVKDPAAPVTAADAKAGTPEGYSSFAFGTEGEPASYVEAANTAVQRNDHATAIFILNNLNNSKTNLTSQQYMSIHESMQILQADLIRRAERGDAKAKRDIEMLKAKLR